MNILVTGSSGLIGSALVKDLLKAGHYVSSLTRNDQSDGSLSWNPSEGKINLGNQDFDVVIHLSGENIASGRWSVSKKLEILNSRLIGTKLLAKSLAQLNRKPKVFISGSAIGYYGDRGAEVMSEENDQGAGFLAEVCQQWEDAVESARKVGIRVVNIRTGMVLSGSGGALKKMMIPFMLGLGGVIGNGKQYISWVSEKDIIGIIKYSIVKESLSGPINAVSPNPVSNHQFTKTLGKVIQRPTLFPLPVFVVKMIFGEMGEELLLSSTRAIPKKLLDSGYMFSNPELEETLFSIYKN